MLISLLEKVELTSELHVRLSASALELRTVLVEPDLASATPHDLNAIMDAFLGVLSDIETTQLPVTSELWSSLTEL